MITIRARNVNDAWLQAKYQLNRYHVARPSRYGDVWEAPEPVTTAYHRPTERILLDPVRDCNPFFHLFEGLWMLAGRQDVAWVEQFTPRMREFSDYEGIFHGAYGHRWRFAFDLEGGAEDNYADQLPKIIRMLKKSHDERRAVLQMWHCLWDLERPELKDLPCNTHIYFKVREGALSMTVCCRSNDIVWGCYGANAVHMSMLQEYVASMVGVPVGTYYQISDSWHAYTERWEKYGGKQDGGPLFDLYTLGSITPYPMVDPEFANVWDEELIRWFEENENPNLGALGYRNRFFPLVAQPLYNAWCQYKEKHYELAMRSVLACTASDWRLACAEWLHRRINRAHRQQQTKENKDAVSN